MPHRKRRRGYKMVNVIIGIEGVSTDEPWSTLHYFLDVAIISQNIGKYRPRKCSIRKLIAKLIGTYHVPKWVIKMLLFTLWPFLAAPHEGKTPEKRAIAVCKEDILVKELQKFYKLRFTAAVAKSDEEDNKLYRRATLYTLPFTKQAEEALCHSPQQSNHTVSYFNAKA